MDSIEKEDDPDKKQILINNAKDFWNKILEIQKKNHSPIEIKEEPKEKLEQSDLISSII
jgi:hypothetical protein